VIGGKNARENDMLVSKHAAKGDLFFHADINGGSAVILKGGEGADEGELKEVAQWAASFSNAWKNGNATVDVYAVHPWQVSKHASGGYVPVGAFVIRGERRWFRATALGLKAGVENGLATVLPGISSKTLLHEILLFPSSAGKEKGEIAKNLAKQWAVDVNDLLAILPTGKIKIKQPLKQ